MVSLRTVFLVSFGTSLLTLMFFFLILDAVIQNGSINQTDFNDVMAMLAIIGTILLGIGLITHSRTLPQNQP